MAVGKYDTKNNENERVKRDGMKKIWLEENWGGVQD